GDVSEYSLRRLLFFFFFLTNPLIVYKIDDEIATIDKEIVKLKDETERLEKEYEQENTLNDVVQNIRSWLKENQNMVKAIKKIDTE
ncbi:hypothetical protein L0N12_25600, partial [Escherichia coli]|uniref:hypothetical protein n=1 Tax=Escherichia coli TaxID=562 RepID=UPI001EE09351